VIDTFTENKDAERAFSFRKREPSGEPFLLEKKKTLGKRRTKLRKEEPN